MGALFEFEQLVLALLNKLSLYFGKRGTNASMRAILDALSVFWNWDVIARQRAKKEECLAFLTAYRIIKPMMKYCEWPLPSVFTYATRAWPSENEMLKQYVLLRTRVCNFFRNNAHYECNDFLVADTARVVPLQRSARLAAAQIRKLFRRRQFNGKMIDASSRPYAIISSFINDHCAYGPLRPAPEPFTVPALELYIPYGHAERVGRAAAPHRLREGAVACCKNSSLMVRVVTLSYRVDMRGLAASFDLDPAWHRPSVENGEILHCYHMVYFGHILRFLQPPETCCETWGSQLHNLYGDNKLLAPKRHIARLFLKAGGVKCIGGDRDEALVEAIAEHMVDDLKRDTFIAEIR